MSRMKEEQVWFLPDGEELRGKEAERFLHDELVRLNHLKEETVRLNEDINLLLNDYKETGKIIDDVLELSEALSLISVHCQLYLEKYREVIENI